MTRLTAASFGGYVPAIVTPFSESGEIMEDAFSDLVEWLIGNGASAIAVAGDNGESWALDIGERQRLTEIAVKRSAGRVPVVTGISAPGAVQTVRYAKAVIDAGASGVLAMPQTYVLKASREELLRRFDTLAKAVDIPIVLYNSPRRTGIDMTIDDVAALLDVAPIIAIKESNRDFFHHTHLLERLRDRISVMVGPCHYIFPGVALGAKGFIATGPELLGKDAGRLVEIARQAPGPEMAALHYKLTLVYQTLMAVGTWPSAFKAALNLIGQPAGVPRDPVMPLAGAELARLKKVLDELGLLSA
ncbi:dihydrodipicolinate synthase family protein [Bosea caraganae]|uniref:Dihydrodipicolinate synthase family protein n=1 Tax=Bosea caraganae TaxID=2763117 RepID=A0A370KYN3_9HYPH|nr:dihydrodipicolinate synthase family protein [Bosea caraganae]RDJ20098.1 dihydrodipicolinate synthase family protein [Bosea caraganae]RDJ24810.1 dihydrodipicolinate synthase family protein [Bosea caraganae]